MRRGAILITLLLILAATSCGGGSDGEDTGDFESVFAAVQGLSGAAREQKLVELAEAEGGELSFYTSMSSDTLADMAGAFEDEYDIDVAYYRASGETVVPRLLEESDAGFHGADLVRVNGLAMTNLANEGILVPYRSPHQADLIEGTAHEGWTTDSFATFVLTWNTKLVHDPPTSWEELADPRWDGQVAIEAGDVDWYKALWEFWVEEDGKTAQQADRLFREIASNARVVRGHTLLGQLMAAGEFALAPNYINNLERFKDEGAPVAWQPAVEPIFPEGQGVGLVEGARHPAAAVLFHDFLLTAGQKILVQAANESARKDLLVAPATARRVIDFASLAADQERWTSRFERLLALGQEVEEP